MVLLKTFLNDQTKKVPQWWYLKCSLMMVSKNFHSDGTKKFFNDGTEKFPQWCY